MVREIMHDPFFLSMKSSPADVTNKADLKIADDLTETLRKNAAMCVGMAANMIGELKCIIVFYHNGDVVEMFNPEIVATSDPYDAMESCLSLQGGARPVKRYNKIKVRWQTRGAKTKMGTFTGDSAQRIQHEVDHCNGVLI